MKKRFYIVTTIMLSAAALSLSSCLKDSRYVDFGAVGTTVELPLEAYNLPGNLVPEALPITSAPQTIPVIVNVASPKPLKTALNVTLGIDQAALTAYNHANGLDTGGNTPYVIPPANTFTISNYTVTVPANQREATFNIQVNTSVLDPSGSFVIPISIISASGQQVSIYKTLLLNVQAKNQYDGAYTVTGTLTDAAAATITGAYPELVYLETQGASTDAFYDPAFGNYHEILSNGSASYYSHFGPVFTFDPTSNKITSVTNLYGQPDPVRLRAAQLDPTGVNAFTTGTPGAAGSVFQVKYIMTQGGAPRTTFDETFTYKGPRP